MPIYEYCCEQCGHALDILQKMSDAPITLCPHCQQHTLTKLISAAGFRLSGSGWYETDFKSGTDKKRNLTETASGTTESKSASTTTDATNTTKTASTPAASGSSSTAAGAA